MSLPVRSALALSLLFIALGTTWSQTPTTYNQTLKGVILDKAVKTPLIGATVVLQSTSPQRGATSDVEGRFRLANVPIGKHSLRIQYLGYKEITINNIQINSGKETELTIELEENILQSKEVVITAKTDKNKPLNELSTVSSRTFSVEETQRFAAAVNDPARMAASYAGVVMGSDGNNTISIRGNAPNGLLWRMEGIDIPNPNHFSAVGSAGGGISILSAQLLSNSDFMTGAFAAEYGNALSGVFDLKLRKGNSEKREFTLQAGFLGLDAAAEGPFRAGKRTGSYLINYRYSTLSILSKLGVNIGDAQTDFQDLSFNVYLPAGKAGVFTFFGMGGLSKQQYQGVSDSLQWEEDASRQYVSDFLANTGVVGMTHSLILGPKTYLKSAVAVSGTDNGYEEQKYESDYRLRTQYFDRHQQGKLTVSSTLHHKFNARHFLRAGAYVNGYDFRFRQKTLNEEGSQLEERLNNQGRASSLQAFAQWQYRPTERLTLNAGAHSLFFFLNGSHSLEPRLAARYAFSERQTLSIGYGLHTQMQPMGVYFTKTTQNNTVVQPNRDLKLTQAHHLVLSYDQSLPGNWHIKPELYLQLLDRVPVSPVAGDPLSTLNQIDGFVDQPLVNKGAGRNYGAEITVEKFLTRGFYLLFSGAVYESKFRTIDGRWHDTRFNTSYVSSLTTGKEWTLNGRKNRILGVNLKCTAMGGLRETPIDLAASIAAGKTVRDLSRPFETQMPAYFRLDAGVRLKRNYRAATTTLSLDVQNTTNRQNVQGQYFDNKSNTIKYFNQAPLIPILAYKIEF